MGAEHVLVGFGFGPIQAGLFVREAAVSGNFRRMVVAEIDGGLVGATRHAGNRYALNVAHADHVGHETITGVELLNPLVPDERERLLDALSEATEVVTALPSVDLYEGGAGASVAPLLAEGLRRGDESGRSVLVYTAENNNHAAEILADAVGRHGGPRHGGRVHYLNTVIGKMSRTVTESAEIEGLGLVPIVSGLTRAFLVESFNRILVSRPKGRSCAPGIRVFEEKDDLLPFEEAKLYGHNAVHALLAYLGALRGYRRMAEVKQDLQLMRIGRSAFLDEAGAALLVRHGQSGDRLFTPDGFREYVEDLLARMTNPHLGDTVERIGRDPVRKLGVDDRLFGAMSMALEAGIEPRNLALGAAAGLVFLLKHADRFGVPDRVRCELTSGACEPARVESLLRWIWADRSSPRAAALVELATRALRELGELHFF